MPVQKKRKRIAFFVTTCTVGAKQMPHGAHKRALCHSFAEALKRIDYKQKAGLLVKQF